MRGSLPHGLLLLLMILHITHYPSPLFANQVQTRTDAPALSDSEFYLRAFDKRTGAVVWEYKMKDAPFGTPMTFSHHGKQYIVVAAGGAGAPAKLVAFSLP
jgi:hypothetical protein